MNLTELFPNFDVIRHPVPGLPPEWSKLLSLESKSARSALSDTFGLSKDSPVRKLIVSGDDLGILIPRRKKYKHNLKMYEFAIQYSNDLAMIFNAPSPEVLKHETEYSDDYLRIVKDFGSFRFNQFSGNIIWPCHIPSYSQEVYSLISNEVLSGPISVFFDHNNGNYDCWLGKDFSKIWFFDHEEAKIELYSSGGFLTWFDIQFLDQCNY